MIIVIGASGFIGKYLVDDLLQQKYKVVATGLNPKHRAVFEKKGMKFFKVDIKSAKDFEKLPKKNIEAVILLAGLLPSNVKEEKVADYVNINILGTVNCLEYCRKNKINKFIFTSSYADVSKRWKAGHAIGEDESRAFDFRGDHAAYVISKNAASDFIEYYNQEFNLQGVIFRLPPVYGVGPHGSIYKKGRFYKSGIQTHVENALEGKPLEVWGDPKITRDLVYVKDVTRAIIQAIKSKKARGLYNMTSGTSVSLVDQAKATIEIFSPKDKKSKIVFRPDKKNNTPSFLFDISKARKDFGYRPNYVPYKKMLLDYKEELEAGEQGSFFKARNKK